MARTIRNYPPRWNRFEDFFTKRTLSFHQRAEKGLVVHEISRSFRGGRIDDRDTVGNMKIRPRLKQLAGKVRRRWNKDIAFHGE